MTTLIDFLSYGFIQRALAAGVLIAVLCSVLGVFLVLRRLSLIGDGLAHVTFGSAAISLSLKLSATLSLFLILPLVMISSLGIMRLTERARLNGDAAIGIVSALGISAGVLLASRGGGLNSDLMGILFGNILAVTPEEMWVAAALFCLVGLLICLFFNDLVAITFSEELARVSGVSTSILNMVLVLLTSLTVVLAMKLVGIMLISAMLILPAASVIQIARGFRMCVMLAALQGGGTVVLGIIISFFVNTPPGATMVLLNFTCFVLALAARRCMFCQSAK